MHYMSNSLYIAGQLAQVQHALNDMRDNKPVQNKDWVLSLFNINSTTEGAGKITYLLLEENRELAEFLFEFSNKINSEQELSESDWDTIHGGLISYRTHLLSKSRQCLCGC